MSNDVVKAYGVDKYRLRPAWSSRSPNEALLRNYKRYKELLKKINDDEDFKPLWCPLPDLPAFAPEVYWLPKKKLEAHTDKLLRGQSFGL